MCINVKIVPSWVVFFLGGVSDSRRLIWMLYLYSKVAMIHVGSGHQLVFFVVTRKVKFPIVLMFMSKWKSRILMILTFFVSKDL